MSNAKISAALTRETNGPPTDATKEAINLMLATKKMVELLDAEGMIDTEQMKLTFAKREDRKEAVKALAEKGASNRKIAKLVGVSPMQVGRDLGETKVTPSVTKVTPKSDPETSAKARKRAYAEDEMPTEAEAEKSEQEALYDQACLILEEMSDSTRRRFVAFLKEAYDDYA